jgi:heme-degrading monooxygenase HmoA
MIAQTPQTPYYAVIFTSVRTKVDEGYGDMADAMQRLGVEQDGFLGLETVRNEIGITVSYWQSLDAIKSWKANAAHLIAQKYGQEKWYENYKVRVCKVERDYEF